MYDSFFGFRERPFRLTPNPRFLYLNPDHREALATLRYGLSSSLGITLLLGEAGAGKTTLLRAALEAERRPEHRTVVLDNPTLASGDFYEILADRFCLAHTSGSKGQFLLAFEADVRSRHASGGITTLVVDEAHSLTHELFEEIRLLANIDTPTAKLVNLVLVGQPELAERLNHPSLRQFKQRVILRCSLAPLDLECTASYIASRLRVAGAVAGQVFTKEAVRAIYDASHGIPRTIGVICENALLAGFAAQKKPVDRSLVIDVCRDLDVPVNGTRPSGYGARLDHAAAQADEPAPAPDGAVADDPPRPEAAPPRWRTSPWFSSQRRERRPEPAAELEPQPERASDRTRIFKF